jgi:hypothetical protein
MNESQRAMVAAAIANVELCDNQHKRGSAKLRTLPITNAAAAKMLNVGLRSVEEASTAFQIKPQECGLIADPSLIASRTRCIGPLRAPRRPSKTGPLPPWPKPFETEISPSAGNINAAAMDGAPCPIAENNMEITDAGWNQRWFHRRKQNVDCGLRALGGDIAIAAGNCGSVAPQF